jgi:hypothetical protein
VVIVPDYIWPQNLLVPRKAKASLIPFNTSGGQGFTNAEQVIGNTPGRWRLDLSDIRVVTDEQRLAWEAMEFGLRGRAKTVLMPIYRWRSGLVPWPTIAGAIVTSAPGYTVPVILAYALGQVLEGASTMTIRLDQGAPLQPGHIFGHSDRLYGITEITSVGSTGSSPPIPTYTIKFAPPIRERIEDVDALNFDSPKLRCRMSEDTAMAIEGGWDFWKSGSPNLTFWEDLTS